MPIISSTQQVVDTSSGILAVPALCFLPLDDSGASVYARNRATPSTTGTYSSTNISFKQNVLSSFEQDGIDLTGGSVSLPSSGFVNMNGNFGVLFSYRMNTSGVNALDRVLMDITDGTNHLKVLIPANTKTIKAMYNATSVTGASDAAVTDKGCSVMVRLDGTNLTLYKNGFQDAQVAYTPTSWTPTSGIFSALAKLTTIATFGTLTDALVNTIFGNGTISADSVAPQKSRRNPIWPEK